MFFIDQEERYFNLSKYWWPELKKMYLIKPTDFICEPLHHYYNHFHWLPFFFCSDDIFWNGKDMDSVPGSKYLLVIFLKFFFSSKEDVQKYFPANSSTQDFLPSFQCLQLTSWIWYYIKQQRKSKILVTPQLNWGTICPTQ